VISSQLTAADLRFTVRLIFAKGSDEVRYQDEQLTLVPDGSGLKIDGVTDSPPSDLGHGPTIISISVKAGQLVVVFDSDLDPASTAHAVTIAGPDGKPLGGFSITYDHRQLTVAGTSLQAGAQYTVTVEGVRDIAGHSMTIPFSYDFLGVS
jgi:hypothetical protein